MLGLFAAEKPCLPRTQSPQSFSRGNSSPEADTHYRRTPAAYFTRSNDGNPNPAHHRKATGRLSVRDVLPASCGIK